MQTQVCVPYLGEFSEGTVILSLSNCTCFPEKKCMFFSIGTVNVYISVRFLQDGNDRLVVQLAHWAVEVAVCPAPPPLNSWKGRALKVS